jgi:hypothetical protein
MRRRPLILTSVVTVVAFSVLAAGCGSGSSPNVANNASSATATTSATPNALLAFSRCMRSNGLTSFPDPQQFVGGNVKLTIHRLGLTGPRFETAMNACDHLLPSGPRSQQTAQQQRAQLAAELSFARCMRSHGLARFPDPNSQGQLSVEMVQAQGIDVHSSAVLHVVQACLPASHGWLTAAKVRDTINNAGRGKP